MKGSFLSVSVRSTVPVASGLLVAWVGNTEGALVVVVAVVLLGVAAFVVDCLLVVCLLVVCLLVV